MFIQLKSITEIFIISVERLYPVAWSCGSISRLEDNARSQKHHSTMLWKVTITQVEIVKAKSLQLAWKMVNPRMCRNMFFLTTFRGSSNHIEPSKLWRHEPSISFLFNSQNSKLKTKECYLVLNRMHCSFRI